MVSLGPCGICMDSWGAGQGILFCQTCEEMSEARGGPSPQLLPEGLRRNWLILFPGGLKRRFEA